MLSWLSENIGTIIICIVLAGIVFAIIINLIRKKKKGQSTCGCGCSGCPMSDTCHKPQ